MHQLTVAFAISSISFVRNVLQKAIGEHHGMLYPLVTHPFVP